MATKRPMKAAITELGLKALTAADKGRRLPDGGSLIGTVRVSRDGSIIVFFELRYKFGGRQRAIACGTWPTASLSAIRKKRDAYRGEILQKRDPLAASEAAKIEHAAAVAEAKVAAQARLDAVAAANARMTVTDAFDRWEKLALSGRKDGGAEVRRMFEKDVLPTLGALAIADVRKGHVADILDRIAERGVGRMVALMLAQVRQLFRFAVARDWIDADPTVTLAKKDFGGKQVERDRVLSEDEIRDLAKKIPTAKFTDTTVASIWIMLGTCCRVGELSKAMWADVDLDGRRWRIPPESSKNGKEHVIALSDFAVGHFQTLRKHSAASSWVLPNAQDDNHVDEKSLTKQVRDRQRTRPMKGRSKCSGVLILTGGEWTPHDLRRTGATIMGELGTDGDVIERCLNHVEQNKMKRTYQRQKTEDAKAEAWRLLGDRLALLTSGASNVVTLPTKDRTAAA